MTTHAKIVAATERGLHNADLAATEAWRVGLSYAAACALLMRESKGLNVYGHDVGGALSGFPGEVNAENYAVFKWLVMEKGMTSNGVGPCQITYAGSLRSDHTRDGGYFRVMEAQNLLPYLPSTNMRFGFTTLLGHYMKSGSWVTAGRLYNGSLAYGEALASEITDWHKYLRAA